MENSAELSEQDNCGPAANQSLVSQNAKIFLMNAPSINISSTRRTHFHSYLRILSARQIVISVVTFPSTLNKSILA